MHETTPRQLASAPPLRLSADNDGAPGNPLVVVDLDGADWRDSPGAIAALQAYPRPVVVGVATAPLPPAAAALGEAMTLVLAPESGGRHCVGTPDDLETIAETISHAPMASVTFADVMRASESVSVPQAIVTESLAYSTLLFGPEFTRWLGERETPRHAPPSDPDAVLLAREGNTLTITLNQPERHNAFSSEMRAGLLDGLAIAAADPALSVIVRGTGRSFCSGGDLAEFGVASDPTSAHINRMRNHPGLPVHAIAHRTSARVQGALIGAGIEFTAFAGHISAAPDAFFLLPELAYGQLPGAGGTVSIPRRIGRWRTAYMALTRSRIDAERALRWGLVDDVST